jgi:hypothetical protein
MVEALLTILDWLGGEAQAIARHPGDRPGQQRSEDEESGRR